jgi:hypothetical protein
MGNDVNGFFARAGRLLRFPTQRSGKGSRTGHGAIAKLIQQSPSRGHADEPIGLTRIIDQRHPVPMLPYPRQIPAVCAVDSGMLEALYREIELRQLLAEIEPQFY